VASAITDVVREMARAYAEANSGVMFCVLMVGIVDVDFLGWVVKELGNDESAKRGSGQTVTVCNPIEAFGVFVCYLYPDEFVGFIVCWVWWVHTEILKGW
jgi:hypothetical protein